MELLLERGTKNMNIIEYLIYIINDGEYVYLNSIPVQKNEIENIEELVKNMFDEDLTIHYKRKNGIKLCVSMEMSDDIDSLDMFSGNNIIN